MKKTGCIILFLLSLVCVTVQAEMAIHFLDVGEADAAIVVCDGEAMVVDAGEPGHSQFIYAYLRQTLGIDHLKYVVMTHPHDDHIGGVPAALNACTVENLLSPVREYPGTRFEKVVQAAEAQRISITVPQYGEEFRVGEAVCRVVSPLKTSSNVNNLSIALLFEYGDTRFLLTGDMEKQAEEALLNTWEDIQADVLKVAHHGRDTSSTHMFLRVVNANYYVVSGGAHLAESVFERLDASGEIYTTQEHGTIVCYSDGKEISFSYAKTNSMEKDASRDSDEVFYVGNRNSRKLHYAWCDSVSTMLEKNKVVFWTRQEAVESGYTGCSKCKP